MKIVMMFCLLLCGSLSAEALSPSQQHAYEKLTNELRCMVCQNQTLADSGAPMAADLRRFIRRHLMAGQTADEVRLQLRKRYGDAIDFRPSFNWHTWLLWVGPWCLLGAAIFICVRRGRDD